MSIRQLRQIALLIAAMLSGAPSFALACTPDGEDPVAWAEARERTYLPQVTAIYTGVIEDLRGNVDSGATFTVRRTGMLWGAATKVQYLRLSYESGACSNYAVLWLEDLTGRPLRNGQVVTVFSTPAAEADPSQLYIAPHGPIADGLMVRWRALTGRNDG